MLHEWTVHRRTACLPVQKSPQQRRSEREGSASIYIDQDAAEAEDLAGEEFIEEEFGEMPWPDGFNLDSMVIKARDRYQVSTPRKGKSILR